MNKHEIKKFLEEKPGYLKKSPEILSERLDCSVEACKAALEESRLEFKLENSSDNITKEFKSNKVSKEIEPEFETYLENNGIKKEDVKSVKYWQTASGEQRFSVVTKQNPTDVQKIKKEIEDFAAQMSAAVLKMGEPSTLYFSLKDPVLYEISLPDIHYGKLSEESLEDCESLFMSTVKTLVRKAEGLDIERFLLPIGNDGMNSEGMRQSTTRGTPQHDNAGWKETFRGYWKLIVKAVDYLKRTAPVDIVVVSGNHDYERMFYAGDVLSGWYRNDEYVTVNNSHSSRKYYEYGKNMIMFTHGDNEKPNDMPLIMATEQPEMFARTEHREAHCGHFHKEMVNEYRGIKVRFIPSICPADEWHKRMGYEAKRTGQGYIWNSKKGLEGYLQANV